MTDSPAIAAWREECARIDLKREGWNAAMARMARFYSDHQSIAGALNYPYPPKPTEPRTVAVKRLHPYDDEIRYRFDGTVFEYLSRTGKEWFSTNWTAASIRALASLLPPKEEPHD
jgi:hypothetical protein